MPTLNPYGFPDIALGEAVDLAPAPEPVVSPGPIVPKASSASVFGTAAKHNVGAATAAFAGSVAGAKTLGAAVGLIPGAQPFIPAAGLIGAIGGGIAASPLGAKIQEVIDPTYGEDEEFLAQQYQQHPWAANLGALAPNLLVMRPSPAPLKQIASIPRTLATYQRPTIGKALAELTSEQANALLNVGTGVAMGAAPTVNRLIQGESIDLPELVTGTLSGATLTQPWGAAKLLGMHPSLAPEQEVRNQIYQQAADAIGEIPAVQAEKPKKAKKQKVKLELTDAERAAMQQAVPVAEALAAERAEPQFSSETPVSTKRDPATFTKAENELNDFYQKHKVNEPVLREALKEFYSKQRFVEEAQGEADVDALKKTKNIGVLQPRASGAEPSRMTIDPALEAENAARAATQAHEGSGEETMDFLARSPREVDNVLHGQLIRAAEASPEFKAWKAAMEKSNIPDATAREYLARELGSRQLLKWATEHDTNVRHANDVAVAKRYAKGEASLDDLIRFANNVTHGGVDFRTVVGRAGGKYSKPVGVAGHTTAGLPSSQSPIEKKQLTPDEIAAINAPTSPLEKIEHAGKTKNVAFRAIRQARAKALGITGATHDLSPLGDNTRQAILGVGGTAAARGVTSSEQTRGYTKTDAETGEKISNISPEEKTTLAAKANELLSGDKNFAAEMEALAAEEGQRSWDTLELVRQPKADEKAGIADLGKQALYQLQQGESFSSRLIPADPVAAKKWLKEELVKATKRNAEDYRESLGLRPDADKATLSLDYVTETDEGEQGFDIAEGEQHPLADVTPYGDAELKVSIPDSLRGVVRNILNIARGRKLGDIVPKEDDKWVNKTTNKLVNDAEYARNLINDLALSENEHNIKLADQLERELKNLEFGRSGKGLIPPDSFVKSVGKFFGGNKITARELIAVINAEMTRKRPAGQAAKVEDVIKQSIPNLAYEIYNSPEMLNAFGAHVNRYGKGNDKLLHELELERRASRMRQRAQAAKQRGDWVLEEFRAEDPEPYRPTPSEPVIPDLPIKSARESARAMEQSWRAEVPEIEAPKAKTEADVAAEARAEIFAEKKAALMRERGYDAATAEKNVNQAEVDAEINKILRDKEVSKLLEQQAYWEDKQKRIEKWQNKQDEIRAVESELNRLNRELAAFATRYGGTLDKPVMEHAKKSGNPALYQKWERNGRAAALRVKTEIAEATKKLDKLQRESASIGIDKADDAAASFLSERIDAIKERLKVLGYGTGETPSESMPTFNEKAYVDYQLEQAKNPDELRSFLKKEVKLGKMTQAEADAVFNDQMTPTAEEPLQVPSKPELSPLEQEYRRIEGLIEEARNKPPLEFNADELIDLENQANALARAMGNREARYPAGMRRTQRYASEVREFEKAKEANPKYSPLYSSTSPIARTAEFIHNLHRAEVDKVRNVDKRVGDALDNTLRVESRMRGKLLEPFIDKISNLMPRLPQGRGIKAYLQDFIENDSPDNRAVVDHMNAIKEGTTPKPLTAAQQEIHQTVKDFYQATLEAIKTSKLKDEDWAGTEGYLSHIMTLHARDVLVNKRNSPEGQKLIEYQRKWLEKVVPDDSDVTVDQLLDRWLGGMEKKNINSAEQFGPIDKTEGFGLAPELRSNNLLEIMSRYGRRVAKRLAYHQEFEGNKDAWKAYNDKRTGVKDNRHVQNVMDYIQGVREEDEALRQAVAGGFRAMMLQLPTGMADLISGHTLGWQHMSPKQVVGATLAGWKGILTNKTKTIEMGINRSNNASFAMGDTGMEQSVNVLKRMRDVLNVASGRNFLEQVSRTMGYSHGEWLAKDNAAAMLRGSADAQQKRFVKEFFPEGKASTKAADIAEAAARYVESVQGTYDYRGLPAESQKGSLAPFLSLSRWSIEKLNNFDKHVITPAKEGNYMPLIMATAGAFLSGSAIEEIREMLNNRKTKLPTWTEIAGSEEKAKGLLYRFAGLSSMSGYAGIAGDMSKMAMDKIFDNKVQGFNNPLIEGISQGTELLGNYITALADGQPLQATELLGEFLSTYMQNVRVIKNQINADTMQERDNMRDYRMYKQLNNMDVPKSLTEGPNPFMNRASRNFKKAMSIEEAASLLPEALIEATKDVETPEQLDANLRRLKTDSYQTMPSPERQPLEFARYMSWLNDTQGNAGERYGDYLKHKEMSKMRAGLVP